MKPRHAAALALLVLSVLASGCWQNTSEIIPGTFGCRHASHWIWNDDVKDCPVERAPDLGGLIGAAPQAKTPPPAKSVTISPDPGSVPAHPSK